jgi:hypothetical protein
MSRYRKVIYYLFWEGGLFYDRVTIWIIQRRKVLINNYLERGGTDLIEVKIRHFHGRSEVNHKNREVLCYGRDSNRAPPKYKSRTLLSGKPIRYT